MLTSSFEFKNLFILKSCSSVDLSALQLKVKSTIIINSFSRTQQISPSYPFCVGVEEISGVCTQPLSKWDTDRVPPNTAPAIQQQGALCSCYAALSALNRPGTCTTKWVNSRFNPGFQCHERCMLLGGVNRHGNWCCRPYSPGSSQSLRNELVLSSEIT